MDAVLSQFDADAGTPAAQPNQDAQPSAQPVAPSRFDPVFAKAAKQYGVDPQDLKRLAITESSLNPNAVNQHDSNGGSYGLMQINGQHLQAMGATAQSILDPQTNVNAGAKLWADALDQAGGDKVKAVQIYKGATTPQGQQRVANAANFIAGTPTQASPSPAAANDPLLAQFDSDSSAAAPVPKKPAVTAGIDQPGVIASVGAGAGKMVGSGVLALQQLAGYGLSKAGSWTGAEPIKQVGDWLYNDATTGARNLETQNAPYDAAHPVANAAGQVAGFAGSMLTGAGEALPFAGAGPAASVASAAGRGAVQGAVLNTLTSPATDPNDSFLMQKAKQAILGTAGGGAGGVLGYGLASALSASVGAVRNVVNRLTSGSPAAVADQAVTHALSTAGVDASKVPPDLYAGLKTLAQKAVETGQQVDPAALARLAKAQTLPVPVNPMRFQLTRDPRDYAVNMNLRGITGVGDPITKGLVGQNGAFLANLDAMGAKNGEDIVTAARPVIQTLVDGDAAAKAGVSGLYAAFKNATGKDMQVPLQGLAQDYAGILQNFGKAGSQGGVIPGGVSGSFDNLGLMSGNQNKMFSIETAENLIKTINQN